MPCDLLPCCATYRPNWVSGSLVPWFPPQSVCVVLVLFHDCVHVYVCVWVVDGWVRAWCLWSVLLTAVRGFRRMACWVTAVCVVCAVMCAPFFWPCPSRIIRMEPVSTSLQISPPGRWLLSNSRW